MLLIEIGVLVTPNILMWLRAHHACGPAFYYSGNQGLYFVPFLAMAGLRAAGGGALVRENLKFGMIN